MVCLACLLPIFLIPVVNALPLLFHLIMRKVYGLLGWEYRKPERVPPACPYKPATSSNGQVAGAHDIKSAASESKISTDNKED